MPARSPDDDGQYAGRFDARSQRFQRWRLTVLPDGRIDAEPDDLYTFGRACVLDGFPFHQELRLLLLRSRWLDQRLAGLGPDLPGGSTSRKGVT